MILKSYERIIQETDDAVVIVDFNQVFSMILQAEKNKSRRSRDGAITVVSKKPGKEVA